MQVKKNPSKPVRSGRRVTKKVAKKSKVVRSKSAKTRVISIELDRPELMAYVNAGNKLKAESSQMFGKPCFKVNGKAFTCYFNGDMVFKLGGKEHENAMKLKGAKLFDPSGSGRDMREWVQVPPSGKAKWNDLAAKAMKYVKSTTK